MYSTNEFTHKCAVATRYSHIIIFLEKDFSLDLIEFVMMQLFAYINTNSIKSRLKSSEEDYNIIVYEYLILI